MTEATGPDDDPRAPLAAAGLPSSATEEWASSTPRETADYEADAGRYGAFLGLEARV